MKHTKLIELKKKSESLYFYLLLLFQSIRLVLISTEFNSIE